MAITDQDLVIFQSARMTDFPDGGGQISGTVVQDGQLNGIFPDIPQLDETYGAVNIRKVFPACISQNTDTLLGSSVIITDPPDNALVNITMMSTGSWSDERSAIQERIESYSIQGPESDWILYDTHIQGQMSLRMLSLINAGSDTVPSPAKSFEVGEVVMLRIEGAGLAVRVQYVRIDDVVSRSIRRFDDQQGTFFKDQLVVQIGSTLDFEFPGSQPGRYSTVDRPTKIRTVDIADTSRYYSVKPLTVAAAVNDLQIKVSDPYIQLVPSAQSEVGLIDKSPAGAMAPVCAVASTPIATVYIPGKVTYYGIGIFPKSITGSDFQGNQLADDGAGNLMSGGNVRGHIDYAAGRIQSIDGIAPNGALSFTPAAEVPNITHTYGYPIVQATRRLVYTFALPVPPAPGSLRLDYKSLDKWYRLIDNGAGQLSGAAGTGVGTVDYVDQSVVVTLGALPDLLSSILLSWGSDMHIEIMAGNQAFAGVVADFSATHGFIKPDSVSVAWTAGGAAKTATDDARGILSGDASGWFAADSGAFRMYPAATPEGSGFTVNYQHAAPEYCVSESINGVAGTNHLIIGLNQAAFPGSVRLSLTYAGVAMQFAEDGTGAVARISNSQVRREIRAFSASGTAALGTGLMTGSLIVLGWDNASPSTKYEWRDTGSGLVAVRPPPAGYSLAANLSTGVLTWTQSGGASITLDIRYRAQHNKLIPGASIEFGASSASIYLPISAEIVRSVYAENGWNFAVGTAIPNSGETVQVAAKYVKNAITSAGAGSWMSRTDTISGPGNVVSSLDFTPGSPDAVLPNSLFFDAFGKRFFERNGKLLIDVNELTNLGTEAGTFDLSSGRAEITWPIPSGQSAAITVRSLATYRGAWDVSEVLFRTEGSPLAPASFQIHGRKSADNSLISGTATTSGVVAGTGVRGNCEQSNGVSWAKFGAWANQSAFASDSIPLGGNVPNLAWTVPPRPLISWEDAEHHPSDAALRWMPARMRPDSIKYNAVMIKSIPLEADILGLDPVRLPSNGKVPIFRKGNVVVVHNTASMALPNPLVAGQTYALPRSYLSYARIYDYEGMAIPTSQYAVNLTDGALTMADPLTLGGYSYPMRVEHRIQDEALITDVLITGEISLQRRLTHAFPTLGSYVSSSMIIGDMQARITNLFAQSAWTSAWSDALIGSAPSAQYNDLVYPLSVMNSHAIKQRWSIVFLTSTTFRCYGEHSGVVGEGAINANFSPANPRTGGAYFTVQAAGWGGGWGAGNCIRFNSEGANYPIDLIRTVLQGEHIVGSDSFRIQLRGGGN